MGPNGMDTQVIYKLHLSHFFLFLGGGGGVGAVASEQSAPQESNSSAGLCSNISDMHIPFEIICNC